MCPGTIGRYLSNPEHFTQRAGVPEGAPALCCASQNMPPGRCAGSRRLIRYRVVLVDAALESAVLPVRRRGFKSRRPLSQRGRGLRMNTRAGCSGSHSWWLCQGANQMANVAICWYVAKSALVQWRGPCKRGSRTALQGVLGAAGSRGGCGAVARGVGARRYMCTGALPHEPLVGVRTLVGAQEGT
jgi:hypothetical protein